MLLSIGQVIAQTSPSSSDKTCYTFGNPFQLYSSFDDGKSGMKAYCDKLLPTAYYCSPGNPICNGSEPVWEEIYPGQFTWAKFYTNGLLVGGVLTGVWNMWREKRKFLCVHYTRAGLDLVE